MAAPRDEVHISPWRKGVLIPFWVLQLVVIVVALGIAGGGIGGSPIGPQYNSPRYLGDQIAVVTWSLTIVFCITIKVLIVTEIILFPQRKLREVIYFAFQLTKMSLWTCLMFCQIYNCTLPFPYLTATFGASFAANVILWALFLGPLIYGSVIYHRYRMRNKPPPKFPQMHVINELQQAYQMPTNFNPLSPAYVSHLSQLGASNHPGAQAPANAGKYPSIQVIYNYGPSQGPVDLGQGHIVGDLGQNHGTGNITSPPRTSSHPGNFSVVPNRRPVPSTFNPAANPPVSNYDPAHTDMNYNPPNSPTTTSYGPPPSYVSRE